MLAGEEWKAGKVIDIVQGSARHKTVIHCSPTGRQTHQFTNGPGNTAAYVELTRPDGTWIQYGAGIVPVLPDGRLIMVLEQRPPQGRYEQATHFVLDGEVIDLTAFGPYTSIEFPGGAIDDESFQAGFLRELSEETGVSPTGQVYMGRHLVHPTGSDVALAMRYGVIYLEGMKFDKYVDTDGGLSVLSIRPEDVWKNFYAGHIRSGQAALINLLFYKEIEEMRRSGKVDNDFVESKIVTLKK